MQRKLASLLLAVLAGASAAPAAPSGPLSALFAASQGDTRAAMLVEDGRVIAKRYQPGYSDTTRFISWSSAKSLTAMVVGALVADGKLSLDAPAPLAEWHRPGDPRAAITLRQLLNMASGLRNVEVGHPVEASDTNQVLFVTGTQAMAARAIAAPLAAKPGAAFNYSSLTSIILAEIATRALTDSHDPRVRARAYRDYAYKRVYTPAGVTSAFLEFDGSGTQIGGSLIHMTLPDFARMGAVLLHGRGVHGETVVTPEWLAFMKTPSPDNPDYGGHVWLDRFSRAGGPPTVSMQGHLGQYVVTWNAHGHDYVLVRLGNAREDRLNSVRGAIADVVAATAR